MEKQDFSEHCCHVGCAGYSYAHWSENATGDANVPDKYHAGYFYPQVLEKRAWLSFYSRRFSSVEINSSFYGFPKAETLSRWSREVPFGFSFVMKMPKSVTHDKRLEMSAMEELRRFCVLCDDNLGNSLGGILIQLPPSLSRSDKKLEMTLASIPEHLLCKIAFEFRHESWWCSDVMSILDGKGASMVRTVTPESGALHPLMIDSPAAAKSKFVYIRMGHSVKMEKEIGVTMYRGGHESGGNTTDNEAVHVVAETVNKCLILGKKVFVFLMNDLAAWAPKDALMVESAIQKQVHACCHVSENKDYNEVVLNKNWSRVSVSEASQTANSSLSKGQKSPGKYERNPKRQRDMHSFFKPSAASIRQPGSGSAMDELRKRQKNYFSS